MDVGPRPERRLVKVGPTEIRVHLRGSGPELVLLNGIGGHIGMWEPLVAELQGARRLVMFDAPGAGSTDPLPRRVRMKGLASIVVEILDQLGLQRVDLLGYSWGGALAQQVARDAHHRVRRLVLASTVPGTGGRPPSLKVVLAMLSPTRFSTPEKTREAAAVIYGGDYRNGQLDGRGALRLWNDKPPTAAGYAQQLYAITGWTSLPWLGQIRARTLILSGDDDPLAPAFNARLMARLLRRAELHLVPGGGHLWLLDHAPESARVVEAFLASS
ncbi:alpha/beta fold hydrolase [Nocardioides immobilis]|uniref:Alpha/beta fold hydrolase n=1 Tax=Nocardioides immobilis TaxID=2049295 RepID=A0A417Y0W5_9ACTN|nr:alpha/beta fold hydrolase [Nocardioides immobilis]RHW26273.1 alpha/beta fold hydrolase [Nocardioides immobilis]